MKKSILLLFVFVLSFSANSQEGWVTYYKVNKGEMQSAKEAIAKKTKKYNSSADGELIYTFQVEAGERAQQLVRFGVGPTMASLDTGAEGYQYWMDNVSPLINNVGGTEYVSRSDGASFDNVVAGTNKVAKVLHYNVKRGKGAHFWKFRNNVAKAAAESNQSMALNVWSTSIGGNSGHVMVFYSHVDYSGFDEEQVSWPKVIEAYNELFGSNSFETDQALFNESLEMWGNYSEIWRWLPELSSPVTE
jgi:hypothetical protein